MGTGPAEQLAESMNTSPTPRRITENVQRARGPVDCSLERVRVPRHCLSAMSRGPMHHFWREQDNESFVDEGKRHTALSDRERKDGCDIENGRAKHSTH